MPTTIRIGPNKSSISVEAAAYCTVYTQLGAWLAMSLILLHNLQVSLHIRTTHAFSPMLSVRCCVDRVPLISRLMDAGQFCQFTCMLGIAYMAFMHMPTLQGLSWKSRKTTCPSGIEGKLWNYRILMETGDRNLSYWPGTCSRTLHGSRIKERAAASLK